MRIFVGLVGVVVVAAAAVVGILLAGSSADPLYRPQARVSADPAGYYSPALFTPMPRPGPGDWMAAHPEPAQSFEAYTAGSPVRPTAARHTIVIAPLGAMTAEDRARLAVLREFMEVYYTLPVQIGERISLAGVKSRERTMGDLKFRQYLTTDLLRGPVLAALPKDALCLQAVTMEDLYPEEAWNYVFGQAQLSSRVGVYSLVRLYPAFWNEKDTPEARQKGLVRSLKVLVHETGHMFGVWHCQAFQCNMNGSNSLAESDREPLHMCPECLKKFRWNIGFDVVLRYEALERFYKAHGMADEARWVEARLKECRAGGVKS